MQYLPLLHSLSTVDQTDLLSYGKLHGHIVKKQSLSRSRSPLKPVIPRFFPDGSSLRSAVQYPAAALSENVLFLRRGGLRQWGDQISVPPETMLPHSPIVLAFILQLTAQLLPVRICKMIMICQADQPVLAADICIRPDRFPQY